MIKADEAFKTARNYLISDPIYAVFQSVQPVVVAPFENDRWLVVCEYLRRDQQKERSAILINQTGQIDGFVKVS